MPYYLEIPLSGGQKVLAEIVEQPDDVVPFGRGKDIVEQLPGTLKDALEHVREFSAEVLSAMKDAVQPPERVTVEFGLTLSAKAGVVIAESAAQGHLNVTVEWTRSRPGTIIADESHTDFEGHG